MSYSEIYFNDNKVHCMNETKKAAYQRVKDLLKVLQPYEGKKIVLSDGNTLIKKLKDELDNVKTKYSVQPKEGAKYANVHLQYVNAYFNTLYLRFTVCFGGVPDKDGYHTAHYEKFDVCLGDLQGIDYPNNFSDNQPKILVKLKTLEDFEYHYSFSKLIDLNQQKALVDEYNKKLDELRTLRSKIKVA